MMTLAAAVRPAKIAHVPNPDNDTASCWTNDPRAKLLLESCAARPPVCTEHRQTYGFSVDRWWAYSGYRAEALTAIRDEIGGRMLAFYEEHGETGYEPMRQWCRQPDVTQAIDAAIVARAEG